MLISLPDVKTGGVAILEKEGRFVYYLVSF